MLFRSIKMGAQRPVTFGPDEMGQLRDIVLAGDFDLPGGGSYQFVPDFPARYIADLTNRPKITRKLKVIAACGNGTAGAFAPRILEALGCEVIPMDAELDHTFPRYNPNPEDMKMLHAMADAVKQHGADVALGALRGKVGVGTAAVGQRADQHTAAQRGEARLGRQQDGGGFTRGEHGLGGGVAHQGFEPLGGQQRRQRHHHG